MALTEQRKAYLKAWRLKNLEKEREKQRNWQRKWRKESPQKAREADRKKHLSRREQEKAYVRSYKRKGDSIKIAARTILNNAVKLGTVKRPAKCERCDETKIQGHHPDYGKPLEVLWLCTKCHALEHHPY